MSPVLNTEYKAFQASKFDQANTPRVTTKFLDDQHIGGNLLAPGTTGAGSKSFSAFIVCLSYMALHSYFASNFYCRNKPRKYENPPTIRLHVFHTLSLSRHFLLVLASTNIGQ